MKKAAKKAAPKSKSKAKTKKKGLKDLSGRDSVKGGHNYVFTPGKS